MFLKVKRHINSNLSFLKDKKLLVSISGGIDSVVLTTILHKMKFDISLVHCNFMLRGKESNKDELFVKQLAEKMQINCYTEKFDTNKFATENGISTQMAARDLRYVYFDEIVEKNNLDYLITAHQKDDIIETFIINLTRGTGLDGLTGIREVNGNIVRPLLPFTRNEILVYATRNNIQWREDSSNSSIKYVRNKIRHRVVPVLKELNPSLLETFDKTLENLKETRQIVDNCVEEKREIIVKNVKNKMLFNIPELLKLKNPKSYLYEFLKEFGFTEWEDVYNLLNAQTGKQVFSKMHRLIKDRDELILLKIPKETSENESFKIEKSTKKIKYPLNLKFKIIDVPFDQKNENNIFIDELILNDKNTISIDFEKIQFPLTIRKWEKGDYFYPIGLKGKKKLSKFFKDEKLSISDKENVWLLCSQEKIIWVIGKRLDDRFKISNSTSKILRIKKKK